MRPRHRWTARVGRRPSPSWWELLKLQSSSQRPEQQRLNHRRPAQLLLTLTRFALLMSVPPPYKRELLSRVRQGLPPWRSKRSRRRGRPCRKAQEAVKP
jgi:hypothetical protein